MFRQLFSRSPAPAAKRKASAAWSGASMGKRLQLWLTGNQSINTEVLANHDTLRARSRDMARKSPYAESAIQTIVSNAVGCGIKPLSKCPDVAFRDELQQLWNDWTNEADATTTTDLYGLQSMACRAMVESGECLIRFRTRRPEDGLTVPLQLQILEADHLDASFSGTTGNGNVIKGGIEFNAIGKRVAYHLFREHPGENIVGMARALERVRVPAEEVIHLYKAYRPGQIRGVPWLSRVLVKLYDLEQYDDAELVRKKMAAMLTGFITRTPADDRGPMAENEEEPDAAGAVTNAAIEPGTMVTLDEGEDIKFADAADVGGSYEAFFRQQLRAIAVGMGVTYEQLSGDLTGVNYSSIRAGLLQFRRAITALQEQTLAFQMCLPIWRRWLQTAILSGVVTPPAGMSTRDIFRVEFMPPAWEWVDPLKDQQAAQLAIRNGFTSRRQVVAEQGYDVEQIDREIAEDNARADSLGLVHDSDPRRTQKTGAAQQTNEAPTGAQDGNA